MNKNIVTPPGGIGRMQRGAVVVKPKNMKGTLRRLFELTKHHRNGLYLILLLSAFTSACAIVSPFIIGTAINLIDIQSPVFSILCILLALYITDWLVRFLQQFFMASIGQKVILYIRNCLFGAMEKLPLSFFDKRQHGELMSRLTNDVDNISTTISDSLTQLMSHAFSIVGIFIIMLSLNPILTCVALVSVIFIYLLTRTITKHTRKLFAKQQAVLGKLNGQIEESISGLNMVKAFCREKKMIETFENTNTQLRDISTKALIWSGYLMPIMNVINNIGYVAIATVSGIMASNGMISIGMISSFLLYSRQFGRPFVEIANIYNNFQTAVAGAERIFEILDEAPEPTDKKNPAVLDNPKGDIKLCNVSFGYDNNSMILRNVNLDIKAGTKVAIVGPTGAGKTTIINLLTRFYDVTEGKILLDGYDLREYKMQDLRRCFGVVLQDTSLFGISVRDNIAYGQNGITDEQIINAAKAANADSFIRRLPHGYDTVLTQSGKELSRGEQQLLTIARAILVNAPIMILDEATSSVDTVTEQHIKKAMVSVTQGRTSFIIAHRLSTIRDSDMIILIENGQIAEQGTHDILLAKNGKYAEMYRTQLGVN